MSQRLVVSTSGRRWTNLKKKVLLINYAVKHTLEGCVTLLTKEGRKRMELNLGLACVFGPALF